MERIIRGIMRYRHTTREQMVQEFVKVKNNPHVSFIQLEIEIEINLIASQFSNSYYIYVYLIYNFN